MKSNLSTFVFGVAIIFMLAAFSSHAQVTITSAPGSGCCFDLSATSVFENHCEDYASYEWFGPSGSLCSGCASVTVCPTVVTTYTCVATTTCSGMSALSNTVTIYPLTATASVSTTGPCLGASATLTGAASGGAGSYTYSWSGPSSFSSTLSSVTISTVTASSNGVYTLTVTDASGCSKTTTVLLNQSDVPTAVTATVSPNPVCIGGTVSLSGTATGATSYSWAGPGSYTAAVLSPAAFTTTSSTAGVYTLTATNVCGSTSSTVTLVQNNPPTGVVATATPNPICTGGSLSLSGSATGATSYSWSGPAGYSAAVLSPASFTVTTVSAGVYTLSATNLCGTTTATVSVTVETPLSTPSVTGTFYVCPGATTTLVGTPTGGTWATLSPGTFTISSTGVVTGINTATRSGTYTITNACGSATRTFTFRVNSVASFFAPNDMCVGETATVSSGSVRYTPPLSYSGGSYTLTVGTAGIVSVSGSGSTLGNITGVSAGATTITYTWGPTDASYCAGSQSRTIRVNAAPTLSVTPTSLALSTGGSGCLSGSGSLTATASRAVTGWAWTPASSSVATLGTITNTSTTSSTTANAVGTGTVVYTVSATASNCLFPTTATVTVTVSACKGAPELRDGAQQVDDIKVYPNPTADLFTLELPDSYLGATVTITDLVGTTVRTISGANKTTSVNASELPVGNYIIFVTSDKNRFFEKITVRR